MTAKHGASITNRVGYLCPAIDGRQHGCNVVFMVLLDAPAAALAWLGRQGTRAIAVSVFLGLALPPLAELFKALVTEAIFVLLCLAFLRVEPAALRAHMTRPALVVLAAAWIMLALPLALGLAFTVFGLGERAPELMTALML